MRKQTAGIKPNAEPPKEFNNPSPYKTIAEAADYLRTTPWAIAQAMRTGDLQAKKLGKKFVTTVQWLDSWFERLEDAS